MLPNTVLADTGEAEFGAPVGSFAEPDGESGSESVRRWAGCGNLNHCRPHYDRCHLLRSLIAAPRVVVVRVDVDPRHALK